MEPLRGYKRVLLYIKKASAGGLNDKVIAFWQKSAYRARERSRAGTGLFVNGEFV